LKRFVTALLLTLLLGCGAGPSTPPAATKPIPASPTQSQVNPPTAATPDVPTPSQPARVEMPQATKTSSVPPPSIAVPKPNVPAGGGVPPGPAPGHIGAGVANSDMMRPRHGPTGPDGNPLFPARMYAQKLTSPVKSDVLDALTVFQKVPAEAAKCTAKLTELTNSKDPDIAKAAAATLQVAKQAQ
jgi:hypothetical protein